MNRVGGKFEDSERTAFSRGEIFDTDGGVRQELRVMRHLRQAAAAQEQNMMLAEDARTKSKVCEVLG